MCGSTGCWDNSAAGCWVLLCRRGQTAVIAAIEARIAEWTRLPPDHGEPIQVLRYQNGQKYDAHWVGAQLVPGCGAAAMASRSHCASWLFACSCECGVPPPQQSSHGPPPPPPAPLLLPLVCLLAVLSDQDWFDDPVHNKASGENRVATVLMYLGEVSEGGETTLPLGMPIDEERQKLVNPSTCVVCCCCCSALWPIKLIDTPRGPETTRTTPPAMPLTPPPPAHAMCRALPRQASVLPRARWLSIRGRVTRCCSGTCTPMAPTLTGPPYTPAAPPSRCVACASPPPPSPTHTQPARSDDSSLRV